MLLIRSIVHVTVRNMKLTRRELNLSQKIDNAHGTSIQSSSFNIAAAFVPEFSHWDLRARCIGLVATQRHGPRCVKSFSPDQLGESWIIDVPRAGRVCGNLPFLDLSAKRPFSLLPRSPGSYFVRLTRMDRHNFSANSSIPGRSDRKRA